MILYFFLLYHRSFLHAQLHSQRIFKIKFLMPPPRSPSRLIPLLFYYSESGTQMSCISPGNLIPQDTLNTSCVSDRLVDTCSLAKGSIFMSLKTVAWAFFET